MLYSHIMHVTHTNTCDNTIYSNGCVTLQVDNMEHDCYGERYIHGTKVTT